jgi:hypothetical protein
MRQDERDNEGTALADEDEAGASPDEAGARGEACSNPKTTPSTGP